MIDTVLEVWSMLLEYVSVFRMPTHAFPNKAWSFNYITACLLCNPINNWLLIQGRLLLYLTTCFFHQFAVKIVSLFSLMFFFVFLYWIIINLFVFRFFNFVSRFLTFIYTIKNVWCLYISLFRPPVQRPWAFDITWCLVSVCLLSHCP